MFGLEAILATLLAVAVAVVFSLSSLIRHRRILRASRKSRGAARTVCRKCGYDLTGLSFPRCPECGALLGFDVPVDDLPLTPSERDAIDRRCRGKVDVKRTSVD